LRGKFRSVQITASNTFTPRKFRPVARWHRSPLRIEEVHLQVRYRTPMTLPAARSAARSAVGHVDRRFRDAVHVTNCGRASPCRSNQGFSSSNQRFAAEDHVAKLEPPPPHSRRANQLAKPEASGLGPSPLVAEQLEERIGRAAQAERHDDQAPP